MALNHSVIMGRLCADPELRRTTTGKAVTSFTVAVDNFGKDNGSSFISCVAWDKTGEFIDSYFLKGSPIVVEGRLQTRTYETKDGNKQKVTEVVVTQAHFCGKKEEKNNFGSPAYQKDDFTPLDGDDAELPF